MYCRNCGKEVHPPIVACPSCGVPPKREKKFCHLCGIATQANQVICTKCGGPLTGSAGDKSKVAAGLLGIFLGWLGIHKFYLGYKKEAVTMLVISLVGMPLCLVFIGYYMISAMSIIGLIEGILYLTKSDEEFESLYLQGHQGWF